MIVMVDGMVFNFILKFIITIITIITNDYYKIFEYANT